MRRGLESSLNAMPARSPCRPQHNLLPMSRRESAQPSWQNSIETNCGVELVKLLAAHSPLCFLHQCSKLGPGKMVGQLIEQAGYLCDGLALLVGDVRRSSGQGMIRQRSL